MASSLAWLDHRAENRRQVREGSGVVHERGVPPVEGDATDADISSMSPSAGAHAVRGREGRNGTAASKTVELRLNASERDWGRQ